METEGRDLTLGALMGQQKMRKRAKVMGGTEDEGSEEGRLARKRNPDAENEDTD